MVTSYARRCPDVDKRHEPSFISISAYALLFVDCSQDALAVRSLPTLIWVSPNGEVLTRRGVASVVKDTAGALFPWKDECVRDAEEALESIAEEPVLLAFMDGAKEETQQQVKQVIE